MASQDSSVKGLCSRLLGLGREELGRKTRLKRKCHHPLLECDGMKEMQTPIGLSLSVSLSLCLIHIHSHSLPTAKNYVAQNVIAKCCCKVVCVCPFSIVSTIFIFRKKRFAELMVFAWWLHLFVNASVCISDCLSVRASLNAGFYVWHVHEKAGIGT